MIKKSDGFTIVELLVVIVVIGILAAIMMISFSGVTSRALVASIQSDLVNASTQLELFRVSNLSDNYPTTIDCGLADSDTNKCIKSSGSTSYSYIPNNSVTPKTYSLIASSGNLSYLITNGSNSVEIVTIGSQIWTKRNLNIGTMVNVGVNQTDNGIIEKYCYNDLESNCTTYGAYYQWNEAMDYNAGDSQGICPVGLHIPTDDDWKDLETFIGMDSGVLDNTGFRGTNQGAQIKIGGSSGLEVPLAGNRGSDGIFYSISSVGALWSSSEFSINNAWNRYLWASQSGIGRNNYVKNNAFSVRCVAD